MGIGISVFVKKEHLLHVRDIESQYTRLNMLVSVSPTVSYLMSNPQSIGYFQGIKGAVSVRLKLYGVSFCFVCSHLSAHDHLLKNRIQEYNTIIETHTYNGQEDTPNILYHEYVITIFIWKRY